MQEAILDFHQVDRFVEKLEQSPKVLSEAKRRAYGIAAEKLKALLDAEIGGTGKVQSWQEARVGNFGGFAKVRPKPNTFTEVTKREKHIYAVGYVTNAITSGHYVRTRKTFAQERGYITGRVEGKHFYAHTQEQAGPVAQETAEEIVAALLEFLEGD